MRTLLLIPIIHTESDMGSLLEKLRGEYIQRHGAEKWEQHVRTVKDLWAEIRSAIGSLMLPYPRVRLYQDGLPECGREVQIVKELAAKGSKNHELLVELMDQGARLMGTEDSQLLLREYRLHTASLEAAASAQGSVHTVGNEDRSRVLLAERDRHIAKRINATLQPGEIGLLFLGLAHAVEPLLERDIIVKKMLPVTS